MWGRHEHPRHDDLVRLIDDEASPAERARLDAHLQNCAACREKRAAMASTLGAVDAIHASPHAPADTTAARTRLLHAMRSLPADAPARRSPVGFAGWISAQRWSLAAAALLLGVSLWTVAGRFADPSPRTASLRPAESVHEGRSAALPRPSATPGAVSTLTAAELCAGLRPSRLVPDTTRRLVLRAYGMADVHASRYELDALITPELGGTTDAGNLWPQLYESPVWNARVKDELEHLLPELVCRGDLDLAVAQRAMATDWVAAYKHYFKTDAPLRAHRGPPVDDDDDLILLPASYASR